jgi:hypothetical protein
MYSAYVSDDNNAHSFQLPAFVKGQDNSKVTWGVSEPSAVTCQIDPSTQGIMMTVQKAGSVTIVAQAGSQCGQSTLNVTAAMDEQWQRGNSRYNSTVPLYSGCIGLGHRFPDGGKSACPTQGPACAACHGATPPKNPIFRDIAHTPTQTAGFSDQDLINIVVNGQVPEGGYFDPSIINYPSWQLFHQWSDIQGADQEGMVVYLRSLTPSPQTGMAVDSGTEDDGATSSDGGVVAIGPDASVACGTSTCGQGQVCCVMAGYRNDSGLVRGSCTDPTACSAFALACNGAQDCPTGEVCCGHFSGTSSTASCQQACGSGDDQVCRMPKECPMGDGCRDYPFGGGIQTCQALKDGGHEGGRRDASIDDSGGD